MNSDARENGATSAAPEPEPGPRTRRLVRGAVAVAGITIVAMLLASGTDAFHEFDTATRNVQARLLPPRKTDRIVLIQIDDQDYERLFDGVSPLNPAVIERLLDAISSLGPRAIGVDLETSHPVYRDLRVPAGAPRIVWARDAVCATGAGSPAPDACGSAGLVPLGYLGRSNPTAPAGLITFDAQRGVIRDYQRMIETRDGLLPSFAWALHLAAAGSESRAREADATALSIDLRFDEPLRLHAGTLLDAVESPDSGLARSGIIRDRIVLLGGDYRAARDRHLTALGSLSGMEILAQVLETELDGGGRPAPSWFTLVVLQTLTMLVLVFLFVRFSLRKAFLLSLLVTPAIALAAGFLATGFALAGLAYFLPLMVIMLIHLLYDAAADYRRELMTALVAPGAGPPHRASLVLDRAESRLSHWVVAMPSRFGRAYAALRRRARRRRSPPAVPARLAPAAAETATPAAGPAGESPPPQPAVSSSP